MINPFKETNWTPDLTARRQFGKSWAVGFPVLAAFFSVVGILAGRGVPTWAPHLGAIGGVAGLFFYFVPQLARPAYLVWYFLAGCVGIVVSNLLLAAFFYLVITPFGLVMRAFGRDRLNRAWDPLAASYWTDAEKPVAQERYFRQF